MNSTIKKLSLLYEVGGEKSMEELKELVNKSPEVFWTELAEILHWEKPWTDLSLPAKEGARRWFVGGKVNYHETIFSSSKSDSEEVFVVYDKDGVRLSFTRSTLRETVEKVGAYLLDQGLKPGSRASFCIENRYLSAVYALACLSIGVKTSFIFFRLPNEVVEKQLLLMQPDVFFYEHKPRALDTAPDLSGLTNLKRVYYIDESPELAGGYTITTPLSPLDSYSSKSFRSHSYDAEENSIFLFSSGTSSTPKAIPSGTAGSFVGALNSYYQMQHSRDAIFFALDFSWVLTNILFYAPLFVGRKVVIDNRHFKPGAFHTFEVFEREKVTATMVPIAHFEKTVESEKKYNLRHLFFGGDSLNPAILKNILSCVETKELILHLGYGSTELGSLTFLTACANDYENWEFKKLQPSIGVSYATIEDNTHTPILAIKNNIPSLCPSILEETGEKYKTLWTADSKWFLTGDTFTDHKNYICLSGRADDLIKVKGRWLNKKLYTDSIHEKIGKRVVLLNSKNSKTPGLILLIEGESTDELENTVYDTVAKHFGNYAQPKQFIYVEKFPRSASGKLMIKKLQEIYGD